MATSYAQRSCCPFLLLRVALVVLRQVWAVSARRWLAVPRSGCQAQIRGHDRMHRGRCRSGYQRHSLCARNRLAVAQRPRSRVSVLLERGCYLGIWGHLHCPYLSSDP
ncbi:hypothetical protein IG631_19515 [Alternaria alternata]|nr:hypothetical protein IG631_19515 [Alternaria alternata]